MTLPGKQYGRPDDRATATLIAILSHSERF